MGRHSPQVVFYFVDCFSHPIVSPLLSRSVAPPAKSFTRSPPGNRQRARGGPRLPSRIHRRLKNPGPWRGGQGPWLRVGWSSSFSLSLQGVHARGSRAPLSSAIDRRHQLRHVALHPCQCRPSRNDRGGHTPATCTPRSNVTRTHGPVPRSRARSFADMACRSGTRDADSVRIPSSSRKCSSVQRSSVLDMSVELVAAGMCPLVVEVEGEL